jgi:hypothetical protein
MKTNTVVHLAGLAFFVLVMGQTLGAHDFWIEASEFDASPGELVQIRLMVGERFAGEPVERDERRIERFEVSDSHGARRVPGRDGGEPAGLVRFETPGLKVIGYQSRPASVELEPAAFERYLREEGLEHVIAERAARGEGTLAARERFSRSVKALIRAGHGGPCDGYDRRIGLPLELVPGTSPFAEYAGPLRMRLLHDGTPLPGAMVVVLRKDRPTSVEGQVVARARTNAEGWIDIPRGPGIWLVKAVHMVRAESPDAEWESLWASLTYGVK